MNLHVPHIPKADTPAKQLFAIGSKMLLLATLVALIATSISIRHFQHRLCVNQDNAHQGLDLVLQRSLDLSEKRLVVDLAKNNKANIKIDQDSIASAKLLLKKIKPIDC